MSKVKIVLNQEGVKALLKSQEIQNVIKDCADSVQSTAGSDYKVNMKQGVNRCWATISPASPHAYYSNLKHNTLVKALGGTKK